MILKRCKCPTRPHCKCVFWYCFELHGIRYRRSTKTANRQTAGRIEERRRVAILENRDEDPKTKISLKAHVTEYVEHTKKKNSTAYKDAAVLGRLLDSAGDRPIRDVSPFHIEKWKSGRASVVTRSTVNRELNIVRGCFTRAVEWSRIQKSPCDSVKPYKVDDARVRVLSDNELQRVLTADTYVQLLCRVTLECLPRLSEVLGIHRTHIGSSWIEIRRKGGAVDRVAVTQELRGALLGQVHAQSGYVFGERTRGDPPTEQAASIRIVRELQRLGIEHASHHTMRHTGVTLMLEAGVNPRVIQRLAGWSSLRMLERYGHARDAEIQRAVTSNAAHLANLETAKASTKASAASR